ncbi:MAG: phosphoribosylglycinamide formyltransferase [Clostridia bacterium]|nr:phosphoribosylglycinamide formyltransferase [Clostridia bacterium]
MLNIVVLVSGGGSNLQALIDAEKNGILKSGKIVKVISDRESYAEVRAEKNNIPFERVVRKDFSNKEEFCDKLIDEIQKENADLIILAGFLSILTEKFTKIYENKIINVHPSLIPSFCGDGMYGLKVHKAALKKGVKVTGATVHFVNAITDGGAIILQKPVGVMENDTPETLQKRVMEQAEWKILPMAAEYFCSGKLKIENDVVKIKED